MVNFDLMYQEMAGKVRGRFNQVLIWPGLPALFDKSWRLPDMECREACTVKAG